MEIRMMPLATVEFRHGYFGSHVNTPLSASPTSASIRAMTNHGLWWKGGPGGFSLSYDSCHAGGNRTKEAVLTEAVVLRFLLRLEDPYFYNYTEGPAPAAGQSILYFYNRPGSTLLHAGAQVSGSDLFGIASPGRPAGKRIPLGNLVDRPFDQPFAILGLRLQPGMAETYSIEFPARSSIWHYILVGSHLQDLQSPAVINSVTKEPFRGPASIRLTDGRPALSFVSPKPIGCSEWPGAVCMLVEGWDGGTGKHKVVVPALPVPDVRIISRAVKKSAVDAGGAAEDVGGAAVAKSADGAAVAKSADDAAVDAGGAANYSEILIY
jgi:hypothetical protein